MGPVAVVVQLEEVVSGGERVARLEGFLIDEHLGKCHHELPIPSIINPPSVEDLTDHILKSLEGNNRAAVQHHPHLLQTAHQILNIEHILHPPSNILVVPSLHHHTVQHAAGIEHSHQQVRLAALSEICLVAVGEDRLHEGSAVSSGLPTNSHAGVHELWREVAGRHASEPKSELLMAVVVDLLPYLHKFW